MNFGLNQKIWGPHLWIALHSITFGYPLEPSENDKKNYKTFFELLGHILPCKICRTSCYNFIHNLLPLTPERLESRNSLIKWLYEIHNLVNKKINVDYNMSLDDVIEKYESYRIKPNNVSNSIKCNGFRNILINENNVIPFELCERVYNKYKPHKKYLFFFNYVKQNEGSIKKTLFNKSIWTKRNIICTNIKNYMRCNNKSSFDGTKISKYEVILIMFLTSNLSVSEIEKSL